MLSSTSGFSALTSVYIGEKAEYFDEALYSISQQTLLPNEIVIVEDGPVSDGLRQVIGKWKQDLPIVSVPLERNVGLGKALNAGLEHCGYEYVARFDGDDICVPNRFASQYQAMLEDSDLDLLSGAMIEFEGDPSNEVSVRGGAASPDVIRDRIRYYNPINHPAAFFRKKAVLAVGGYQDLKSFEDYYLWMRVMVNGGKLLATDDKLVYFRLGDAFMSRRSGWRYVKAEFALAKIKRKLKVVGFLHGWWIFLLRSAPRCLPAKVLAQLYAVLRRKQSGAS